MNALLCTCQLTLKHTQNQYHAGRGTIGATLYGLELELQPSQYLIIRRLRKTTCHNSQLKLQPIP
jgi:hypothetical protein